MKLDYEAMIASHFQIIDKNKKKIPFTLNDVQEQYLVELYQDSPETDGVRENILKARQQGFSSLINAIFTVDFLAFNNTRAQIISHKKEETKPFIKRINLFIDSWCEKEGLKREDILTVDQEYYLEHKNGSSILIGTAGAKTLGRGDTMHNIHWSEVGFYPNTSILNAEEIVQPAEEQVRTGAGKIFRESTGNMYGDFFHQEWWRGFNGESNFKSRFYPWFVFSEYTQEYEGNPTLDPADDEMMKRYGLSVGQMMWYVNKRKSYKTQARFLREYPTTPEEAFLASGAGFFDADTLKYYYDHTKDPEREGRLAMDGGWI